MPVKVIVLVLAAFFALPAFAQKPDVGVTGYLDIFSLKGDGISGSARAGYNAGIFADWKIYNRWHLRPEVLFTQKNASAGGDFKDVFPDLSRSTVTSSITLRGVAVPVLVGYQVTPNWTLLAGPQYTRYLTTEERLLRDDQAAFRNEEWGISGGVKWKLSKAFQLQGRYSKGFTNLNAVSGNRPWKSRAVSLGLSWRLL